MTKTSVLVLAVASLAAGAAMASESAPTAPVKLSAEQMDGITAAGYGKTIIDVAGVSFGQLVGPAKKAGTATHSNYAGGARALVETVCVHLPATPGC